MQPEHLFCNFPQALLGYHITSGKTYLIFWHAVLMHIVFLFQCQGQTIPTPKKILANLNEAFQAAMCYVILSRIMSISQLFLHTFDENFFYCNESAKQEAEMIKERAINRKITKWDLNESQTLKISTLNIRSLKKHFIDLREDDFLQKSDIICVNETWLVSDPDENLNGFHGHFINLKS